MKAALEFLRALQERWPAHHPRRHAVVFLAEDGRLSFQLGLDRFYGFVLDSDDLDKPPAQIVEEIAPLLAVQMAIPNPPTAKEQGLPWCCYIPDSEQGQPKPQGCSAPAEWNIHADSDPPDLIAQSCSIHLGEMMTDKGHHSVWPIDPPRFICAEVVHLLRSPYPKIRARDSSGRSVITAPIK